MGTGKNACATKKKPLEVAARGKGLKRLSGMMSLPTKLMSPLVWPRIALASLRPGKLNPGSIIASLLGLAAATVVALWMLAHFWYDVRTLREFDDHIGDGPFQLFNPLRRIAAGQTGGIDFQYFHGLGLPYLHYPLFALLGSDFFASEVARYAIGEFAYLGAFLFVFGCATRRIGSTLALTAIALVVYERICYDSLALPGVNLVGLRSTCPLLALGVLLAGWRPSREAIAAGLLTGLGFLMGTDHGVATAAMLGTVWLSRAICGLPGGHVRYPIFMLLAGAAGALLPLLAIGGVAGARGALRYALVELPADQFWFFGVPPNRFLHFPRQLFSERYLLPALLVPAFAAIALVAAMRRQAALRPVGVVMLGALVYSLLACIGYFGYCSTHYLNPAIRMLLVVVLIGGWHAVRQMPDLAGPSRWLLAGLLATFLLVGPTTIGRSSILEAKAAAFEAGQWAKEVRQTRCPFGPRFRALLNDLTTAIDADRAASGVTRPPVIWSTYAGVLEDHYGVFNPGCDYLIHAVGPERREAYVQAFRDSSPDYVCTFRRSVWPWEEALQNNCWSFYEELIRNYEPLADSWAFRLWKRRPGEWRSPDPEGDTVAFVPEKGDDFSVPLPEHVPPESGVVVEVQYEVKSPLRGVPIAGNLPRFLLHPRECENETPISLPPYRDRWSFAVYPKDGRTPAFFAGTASLVGGKVQIVKVRVRPIRAGGREKFLHDEPLVKLP